MGGNKPPIFIEQGGSYMDSRQRFLDIAHFKMPGDIYIGKHFQWFWSETLKRWVNEGAPATILNEKGGRSIDEFFGFDRMEKMPIFNDLVPFGKHADGPYILPVFPFFERKILKEENDRQVYINEEGVTVRIDKNDTNAMPQWLEYPVKDKKTWETYKKRLDPNEPARFPAYWKDYIRCTKDRDYPIGLYAGSLFGFPRAWMGLEPLVIAMYDNPMLVEDMMEYCMYFFMEFYKKVLPEIDVDYVYFWEDMAYKTGPLISPAFMKKFMVPRYKKMTEYIRSHNIDIIMIDNDGNIDEMIPVWLESGINAPYPLEVAADVDAVKIRKKYGKDIILIGNIDKRALIKGNDAIDKELDYKIPYLISTGGYFPQVDHSVPPQVSYDNWLYYLKKLRSYAQ